MHSHRIERGYKDKIPFRQMSCIIMKLLYPPCTPLKGSSCIALTQPMSFFSEIFDLDSTSHEPQGWEGSKDSDSDLFNLPWETILHYCQKGFVQISGV